MRFGINFWHFRKAIADAPRRAVSVRRSGAVAAPPPTDEQVLLRFYSDVAPELAQPEKVQRMFKMFQRKATKSGATPARCHVSLRARRGRHVALLLLPSSSRASFAVGTQAATV